MFIHRCYPINSVLIDFKKLEDYLAKHPNPYESSDDENSDVSDGTDEDSDDERSSSDSVNKLLLLFSYK